MTQEMTYRELAKAISELPPEQLDVPVRIARGSKAFALHDTALSCECRGPAVELFGENYPMLIASRLDFSVKPITL